MVCLECLSSGFLFESFDLSNFLSANQVTQESDWGRNRGGGSFSSKGAISLALVWLFTSSAGGSFDNTVLYRTFPFGLEFSAGGVPIDRGHGEMSSACLQRGRIILF